MAFPVELKQLPARGRGLITTRHVEAGEVVIAEEPLLLTVAQEFKESVCINCLCWIEHCPGALRCQECCQAAFCSAACQQQAAARPWVHAAATCRAYAAMPQLLPASIEQQNCLRFLIQAAALKAAATAVGTACANSSTLAHTCAAACQVLMSLAGESTAETLQSAAVLHPALCQAIGDPTGQLLSAAEVAALLAKEGLNCFGLLAPLHLQQQQQVHPATGEQQQQQQEEQEEGRISRRLRGGALYPVCSLLNHECLPNVARFDALDAAVGGRWPAQWPGKQQQQHQHQQQAVAAVVAGSDPALAAALAAAAGLSAGPHGSSGGCDCGCGCGSSNGSSGRPCRGSSTTLVTMRALHALPAGSEVVLSYTPLNWDLQERQQQTQQVYGFSCSCPRCLLEASPAWEADQGGSGSSSSSGEWETDSGEGGDDGMEGAAAAAAGAGAGGLAAAHDGGAEGMSEDTVEPHQQQQQEALEPSYLSLFLLKYMCSREECYGTMAAVQGGSGGECECSVCGAVRTEGEFLAELEQQQ